MILRELQRSVLNKYVYVCIWKNFLLNPEFTRFFFQVQGSKVLLRQINKIQPQAEPIELGSTSSLRRVSSQKLPDTTKFASSLHTKTAKDSHAAITASVDEKFAEDRYDILKEQGHRDEELEKL